jgi:hypothetical protein
MYVVQIAGVALPVANEAQFVPALNRLPEAAGVVPAVHQASWNKIFSANLQRRVFS